MGCSTAARSGAEGSRGVRCGNHERKPMEFRGFHGFMGLASAVALHRSGIWFHGRVSQIGLGLAFGGAAGNMLDIVRHHAVVDFIDLRWWPVFNIADIGIVGGLLLAFWR